MREVIEAKMQELVAELQRADEEANKLRPRLRYLEEMMVRTDGALTVLKGLLEANPVVPHVEQPRAAPSRTDAEFAPSWQTVAP